MILTDYFVILHVPKTGGMWLRKVFESAPESWNVRTPPSLSWPEKADDPAPYHAVRVPAGYEHHPRFAVVRNPWDWYVSVVNWFRHVDAPLPPAWQRALAEPDFEGTLRRVLRIHTFSQVLAHADAHCYLRFENLEQELVKLLVEYAAPASFIDAARSTPPQNVLRRPGRADAYTAAAADLVREADADLIRQYRYEF